MAFSTQKDFFHVPFMNEEVVKPTNHCIKLKSYASSTDNRAWHLHQKQKSRFVEDLVKCGGGDVCPEIKPASFDRLVASDELIATATENLTKLENLLHEKKCLQERLDLSNDYLSSAKEENNNIKNVLNKNFDHSLALELRKQVDKLSMNGQLTRAEENELNTIYCRLDSMVKGFEILKAEKGYLQRLLEKLSRRTNLENLPLEPETNRDPCYLQDQVNTLRRELVLLRHLEDECMKQTKNLEKAKKASDRDIAQLQKIIRQRDELRQQCAAFKELENKIRELQEKAKKADAMSGGLNGNLEAQRQYIKQLEAEMQRQRQYFEELLIKGRYNQEMIKMQIQEQRNELARSDCKAQKADYMRMELGVLRMELLRLDIAVSNFDSQQRQLMYKAKRFQDCGYRMCQKVDLQRNCPC